MLSLVGSFSLALARHLKAGGVIINEHVLTREETRRHVETFGRWFDFIHLEELPERLARRHRKPFCLLTFDDGKRSNATEVAPELERLGVPAVFFVVSSALDTGEPFWFDRYAALWAKLGTPPYGLRPHIVKQLPYSVLTDRLERACAQHGVEADRRSEHIRPMTWDDARSLHRCGFTIGAHGTRHAILTRENRAEALENISKSIERVSQEIGEPCLSFAFPNGNYTAELAQHAVRCGVKTVMTTEPTWADAAFPLWRLPRLQFFGTDNRGKIELKTAVAATGFALSNPDGTGRLYRAIQRLGSRRGGARTRLAFPSQRRETIAEQAAETRRGMFAERP
ncbi:MAG TPA: polysaccharide deacetylase family protein [Candidatus Dormibacteraeota bacterium]|nr:polysaccharide deacetylase family protein [Candidatus Dormibacteraeota bacterium]